MTWTELEYPGTRGVDIYDPPDVLKRLDHGYTNGMYLAAPPAYLEAMFQKAGTRKRGRGFISMTADSNGTLYGLSEGSRYVPGGENIMDERLFWEKLDWFRFPILLHTSTDGGRTWTYAGVVAHDEKHRVEPGATDVFSEPSLAVYPDGEWVCVMRTGSSKPLYLVRSLDAGAMWSEPVKLPIRGITPHLVPLPGGVLALGTGRPDCTVHFSLDRGKTWPLSQTLFNTTGSFPDKYANSTANIQLTAIDDHTLLFVHDAFRCDVNGESGWLKSAGYGRIIGRHIFVEKSMRAACISRLADVCKPLIKWGQRLTQNTTDTIPEAVALQRDKKDLKLDGKLDDPFWEGLKTYTLRRGDTGGPPAPGLETTFRVAWADNALYIGIECRENDMPNLNIGSSANGDQKIWEGDSIDLLIQTQAHTYYQIAIGPTGAVVGMDRESGMNKDWSPGAEAATKRGKDFWSGDGFSEPSLVMFPDGEMLCALRTGHAKPLYCVRSYDRGRTWTRAEFLSPRYIHPICGVRPTLVLLKNGILALCTGRPDCTVHFSKDRGHTWFLSETLFATPGISWDGVYSGSTSNNSMIAVDDNTLLYVHDALRSDPSATNAWLQRAGHGLVIARRIEVHAG